MVKTFHIQPTTSTPQVPSTGDHKALNGGSLGVQVTGAVPLMRILHNPLIRPFLEDRESRDPEPK